MLGRVWSSLRARGARGSLTVTVALLRASTRRLGRWIRDRGYRASGLSQAAIDAASSTGLLSDGTILTAKFDGFGGRIGDILNGMRVAESLGARFRFYWPERDVAGIRAAHEVFDPDFLRDHLIHDPELASHPVARCFDRSHLDHLRRGGTVWYQSKHDECGKGKFTPAAAGFRFPDLSTPGTAFARLPLAPRLARVRDWAAGLPRFDAAIHVRRGDIFAGDFRVGGGYADKIIPLPVLRILVERVAKDGGAVLLVGEDLDPVRSRLGDAHRFHIPADYVYPGEPAQDLDDLRDFCMLARADRVIAGHSVFAFIPALIGGVTVELPTSLLTEDEEAEAILEFVRRERGGRDLEVAVACENFRHRFPARLTDGLREELAAIAHESDPENPAHLLSVVATAIRSGAEARAVHLIDEAVARGLDRTIVRMVRCDLDIDRGLGLANAWSGFATDADRRTIMEARGLSGWVDFLVAAELAASGSFEEARSVLREAAAIRGGPSVTALAAVLDDPPGQLPHQRGGLLIVPTAAEMAASYRPSGTGPSSA